MMSLRRRDDGAERDGRVLTARCWGVALWWTWWAWDGHGKRDRSELLDGCGIYLALLLFLLMIRESTCTRWQCYSLQVLTSHRCVLLTLLAVIRAVHWCQSCYKAVSQMSGLGIALSQ
jgi:hypothetical protein